MIIVSEFRYFDAMIVKDFGPPVDAMGNKIKRKKEKQQSQTGIRIQVGDKVKLVRGKQGMVKFIGRTAFAQGEMFGLELDTWFSGGYNGTARGKKYSQAHKGRGYFTRRNDIACIVDDLGRRKEPQRELQIGDSVKLVEKGCNDDSDSDTTGVVCKCC